MTVDIKWVGPPRSFTPGRNRAVRFITLHTTEGSEGPSSAENGAAYDKTRTDGTSTHYFTDAAGPALQEVRDGDRAHAALWHGNEIGIHIEICGRAGQTRAQWLDAASRPTLETTAALVAHLCRVHDIPPVRLTVAQTRAAYHYPYPADRPKGINDHYTITRAFPEDGGSHTDVGPEFPWDLFLTMVTDEMEGTLDAKQTCDAVWNLDGEIKNVEGMEDFPANEFITGRTLVARTWERVGEVLEAIDDLGQTPMPVTLTPEQLAELRKGIAEDVVAELRALQFVATTPTP